MSAGASDGREPGPTAVDVVVLGAGINGAALARELVLNGCSVVVVETDDIAAGTTAWSTRLVHGGLRYLEYGEVGLVRESLAERDRLIRLAPHLVRPLGFVVPVRGRLGGLRAAAARLLGRESLARRWSERRGRGGIAVACGLWLYDLLAGGSLWPRQCLVSTGTAGMPKVDADRYPLAGVYDDAQMRFPERFTVELLVDAREVAVRRQVTFEVRSRQRARIAADGSLRITPIAGGVSTADGGGEIRLTPRAIVNATGAWVDRTLGELVPGKVGAEGAPLIGGTKGSHLVCDHSPLRAALGSRGVYAEAEDGRPVFVLPFGDRLVLVGTTDIPFDGNPSSARTDEGEIDYLLAAVRRLFPAAAPPRGAVVQHYCGVRPLPARRADGRAPAGITRRHMLVRHPGAPLPLWSIVGGKLTTCRSLAEGAAAEVLAVLGMPVTGSSRARPLPGACGDEERDRLVRRGVERVMAAGQPRGVAEAMADAVVGLLGARAESALGDSSGPDGLAPLAGSRFPRGIVRFCLDEEWAGTLADVVERRLLLSFDPGLSTATLRAIAAELVAAGRLAAGRADAEVAALESSMADRYGKRIRDVERREGGT